MMLSLRPQGRFSKRQLCWQGCLPCCLTRSVPSDSGKIWAAMPQTSSSEGGFLEAVDHSVGTQGALLQGQLKWGGGKRSVTSAYCSALSYPTSPRKLAASAVRKQHQLSQLSLRISYELAVQLLLELVLPAASPAKQKLSQEQSWGITHLNLTCHKVAKLFPRTDTTIFTVLACCLFCFTVA